MAVIKWIYEFYFIVRKTKIFLKWTQCQFGRAKYQFWMTDFVCLRRETFESLPKFSVEFFCEPIDTSMIQFAALPVTHAPPIGSHENSI